ncbi:MAG: N-acetyl sugar amidotransferase [Planctomycetes bacterium]|nr:N-acetyl sugar amidotransferase [Planctomycetota bacterium]
MAPRYCSRCILPDSRPGVALDAEGVCAGCRNAERKTHLDWNSRRTAFVELAASARAMARARGLAHDCIVPVSGGKDSFWQVVTCLEHGLRPLCVSYVTAGRTALGKQNLDALARLDVELLEVRLDAEIERRFVAKAFRATAIGGLVTHMAIYRWPVRIALDRGIPLVVYGENSAFEYGSDDQSLAGRVVDQRWLERFGVTAGTKAEDWIDAALTAADLAPLRTPTAAELAAQPLQVVFLGWFFAWDPRRSLRIAQQHGFSGRAAGPRVGHYDFVNIDDDFIGVHHHPKWHKFGITRSFDTLSMEIRAGRMARDAAIAFLRQRGDETPWDDIRAFCAWLGIDTAEYFRIVEGFRDRRLWLRRDGRWQIDGFLIEDFDWPVDAMAWEAP